MGHCPRGALVDSTGVPSLQGLQGLNNGYLQPGHLDAHTHAVRGYESAELVAHVREFAGHELGGMKVFIPPSSLHRVTLLQAHTAMILSKLMSKLKSIIQCNAAAHTFHIDSANRQLSLPWLLQLEQGSWHRLGGTRSSHSIE